MGPTALQYWFIQHHPTAAFAIAGLIGRVLGAMSPQVIPPDDVARLFDGISLREARRIVRASRWLASKNRVVARLAKHGGFEQLSALVRWHGAGYLRERHARREPVILLAWHLGPYLAVAPGLHGLSIPALFIVKKKLPEAPPGIEIYQALGDALLRGAALKGALDWLRSGGIVLIAGDGRQGVGTLDIACLGRTLRFQRGPAVLARLSGAPLVPVVAEWDRAGRAINVTVHAPLPKPAVSRDSAVDHDRAILTAAAVWFERYVRTAPGQLEPDRLRELASYTCSEPHLVSQPVRWEH